ncbi:hypothetical protein [Bordetella pertussis]|uniref:hypothetical protein n=1 Tax=Bordetella pertussis TaxID=520 RepID=UPI0002FBBB10
MNWGGGDFQFLKSGSDEPCIQPIESSQLPLGFTDAQHPLRDFRLRGSRIPNDARV